MEEEAELIHSDSFSGHMRTAKLIEARLQIVFLIVTILLLLVQHHTTVQDLNAIAASLHTLTRLVTGETEKT